MGDTSVRKKSIVDMQMEGDKFYIDAYQRGYRWSENQVRDLLEDIYEFFKIEKRPSELFYCLQPIIVTKADDGIAWKVIDGQQRLTTIYLIYLYYCNIDSRRRRQIPFEISYNNKPLLEECMNKIRTEEYTEVKDLDSLLNEYEKDIDCYYVISAYSIICDFFEKMDSNPLTQNDSIGMKEIFDNKMKIIWYELVNCDMKTEVEAFSRINMGKIPLTNAELIKALLLKNDLKDAEELTSLQESIAIKWDEIEAQLNEPNFWNFLVNDEEDVYSTRIDFIFNIMAKSLNAGVLADADKEFPGEDRYTVSASSNKDKFSFYVFNNYVRYLTRHNDSETETSYINKIWSGVCNYYLMFRDWYQNIHWYHMIGFIVEAARENYIDKVFELCNIYMPSQSHEEGHKTYFENELRKKIIETVFGGQNCTKEQEQDQINLLEYGKGDQQKIRNVLLLYNIAFIEICNENGRFPFEKYKGNTISWDIEHINAVADDMPADELRDKPDNQRLLWLKETDFLPDDLLTSDGRNVKELITQIIKDKLYLSKNQPGTGDFVQAYEAVIKYFDESGTDNSICNLTLLDTGTNRSYKNYVFPVKRRIILENSMKDVFIPICTKNVFLKAFKDSRNLLKWTDEDKMEYKNDITVKIAEYLRMEDRTDAD